MKIKYQFGIFDFMHTKKKRHIFASVVTNNNKKIPTYDLTLTLCFIWLEKKKDSKTLLSTIEKLIWFHFHFQDEIMNNTTRSELSFVPSTEDDGKSLTCRAENPNVTGLFLETAWKLDVVCKYIIILLPQKNTTYFNISSNILVFSFFFTFVICFSSFRKMGNFRSL